MSISRARLRDLQRRWEALSFEGRVEVLDRLMLEKCIEYGVSAPRLKIADRHRDENGVLLEDWVGVYTHADRTITLFWDAGADRDIRAFDYFEQAIYAILHESAHRIDNVHRDEGVHNPDWWERETKQRINEAGELEPHPNIEGAAQQWTEELLGPNLDLLLHVFAEGEARHWELYGPRAATEGGGAAEERWRTPADERSVPYPEQPDDGRPGQSEPLRVKKILDRRDPRDSYESTPDNGPAPFDHQWAVAAVARSLRNPNYWLGDHSSVQLNRDYMLDIWDMAMRLTRDNESAALQVAGAAVQTRRLPGESPAARDSRLTGVPFRAFGADPSFEGVEMVEHFFKAARDAYVAAVEEGEAEGWLARAFGWIVGGGKDDRQESLGVVWAKSLGTSFGAVLRWNPDQSIASFLRSAPRFDEALPIRVGSRMRDGYVSNVVVPAPEVLAGGHPIEIRAVDRNGYAQTFRAVLGGDQQGRVRLEEVSRSKYRLSRDDPWYFSGADDSRDDDRAATLDQLAEQSHRRIDQHTDSARELRDRLIEDLEDLRANQRRLDREVADRQRFDQEEEQRRLERQQHETEQRIRETQARIEQNDRVLGDLSRQRQDLNERLMEQARASQTVQEKEMRDRLQEHSERARQQQERQHEHDQQTERSREEQRDRDRRDREERDRLSGGGLGTGGQEALKNGWRWNRPGEPWHPIPDPLPPWRPGS